MAVHLLDLRAALALLPVIGGLLDTSATIHVVFGAVTKCVSPSFAACRGFYQLDEQYGVLQCVCVMCARGLQTAGPGAAGSIAGCLDGARDDTMCRCVTSTRWRDALCPYGHPPLLPNCVLRARRLQDLVQPVLEPGGQGFVDFAFTPDGALQPEVTRVWQFAFSIGKVGHWCECKNKPIIVSFVGCPVLEGGWCVRPTSMTPPGRARSPPPTLLAPPSQVEGVGPTGLRGVRAPCLHVARMAIFDRQHNRFLGNVAAVRPRSVVKEDTVWQFDQKVAGGPLSRSSFSIVRLWLVHAQLEG
jgi:hypothetical protein